MDSILATMDGHLEEVMGIAENIMTRGDEAGLLGVALVYSALVGLRVRVYLGASLEASEIQLRGLLEETKIKQHPSLPQLCLALAHLGKKEESSEILEREVVERPDVGTIKDETNSAYDILYLEAAVLVGHRRAAELLVNRFKVPSLCTTGIYFPTCVARHMGGATALLGKYDEARNYYNEAIKVCTEMPFRPELALSRLQLAELLLERYPAEKKEALEHLDFAIREFQEMKMRPSLERALRHKDILKA
jgi:tetratricopeptide (TPR) repeat protein